MPVDRSYIKKGVFLTGGTYGAFVEPDDMIQKEHAPSLSEVMRDHAYCVAKIEKMIESAREKIEALRATVKK